MEEELQYGKRETASLRRELSRVQESLEQRTRPEAESTSLRTNAVEKSVAEVQSDVETLRNALREVRDLAEGAQKKAASTSQMQSRPKFRL
jgi:Ribonuclease G/E